MRSSSLALLASSASSALAASYGWNYASQGQTEASFKSQFNSVKSLTGATDWTSARLYTMIQDGTTSDVIQAIQAAIDTKTTLLLGVWASETQDAFNNEITALKSAISTYGSQLADIAVGISVGSEDLYRISPTGIAANEGTGQSPDVLVSYIKQVRNALAGTPLKQLPVGHVDTWNVYTNSSNSEVISNCDFLGLDEYPYYQTTDTNTIANAKSIFFNSYDAVKAVSQGKPIWITESGWPVSGPTTGQAVPGTKNAEKYWQDVACTLEAEGVNTWWYILIDSGASPSFGVQGQLNGAPLYDLACNTSSSASASASSAIASASTFSTATGASGSASASATASGSLGATSSTHASGSGAAGQGPEATPGTGGAGPDGSGAAGASSGATGTGAFGSGSRGSASGSAGQGASGSGASATYHSPSATGTGAASFTGAANKMGGSAAALALGAVAAVAVL